MKISITPAIALVSLLGGCAHMPNATIGYYLPTSDVSFKVIRTIACDAGGNPIIATAVTPTVRHFANKTDANAFKKVVLTKLNGDFSDADVKFDFYEDGRLSAVNATSTGQGEAILKTAITLTASAVKLGTLVPLTLSANDCKQIKDFGGGKPLTVTYNGTVKLADGATTTIDPDADSAFYADTFKTVLLPITAKVIGHTVPDAPVDFTKVDGDVVLELQQPGMVHIELTVAGTTKAIWDDSLVVASVGTPYELPIPRPATFGKKTLAASFSESGAVKSVQFVSNTGTGQALNVASAGLTALQGDTTAQQAAEVKAQGDLIAAQQRLVACKADPTTCK